MSEQLRKSAAILLSHAEHGIGDPFPQWLVDCRRDIEAAAENPTPVSPPPGSQYLNLADGKLYEIIAENQEFVEFRLGHGGKPHHLGRAEFEKRFQLQSPPPGSRLSGVEDRISALLSNPTAVLVNWLRGDINLDLVIERLKREGALPPPANVGCCPHSFQDPTGTGMNTYCIKCGEPEPTDQKAKADLMLKIIRFRNKYGNPDGTLYEQGQWDMAQRILHHILPPETPTPAPRTMGENT